MSAERPLPARLVSAIEAGDIDAISAVYAPHARIWHNHDGIEQTVEENLRVLKWMRRTLRDIRYDAIRVAETPTGFVQQHVLRATIVATGAPFELPACIVCTVEDGRIVRLEEYLDSAHVAPLLASTSP